MDSLSIFLIEAKHVDISSIVGICCVINKAKTAIFRVSPENSLLLITKILTKISLFNLLWSSTIAIWGVGRGTHNLRAISIAYLIELKVKQLQFTLKLWTKSYVNDFNYRLTKSCNFMYDDILKYIQYNFKVN